MYYLRFENVSLASKKVCILEQMYSYILVLAKCKTVSDSNDVTLYYVSLDSSMMISRPRLHFHLPLLATHSGPYGRERKHCKARKEASNWAGRW
jgi:hypothetical protein